MNTSTNVKTNFLMPDSDVSVTPNWIVDPNLQYLTITDAGAVSASDKLKVMTADTPIDLVIPSSINGIKVTSIADDSFTGCKSLRSVTIPDGVTSIGYFSFKDCTSMSSVNIPDTVTVIEGGSFDTCESLISIHLPGSLTHIKANVFVLSGLTSVVISEGVTSIGSDTFLGCKSLRSVTIPSSVTTISNSAFTGCTKVTFDIKKPINSIAGAPWGASGTAINWLG